MLLSRRGAAIAAAAAAAAVEPRRRGDFEYQRCELEEAFFIGESSGVVRWGVWEGRSMGRRRRRLILREGFRIQE